MLLRALLMVVAVTGLFSGIALFIPWESTVALTNRLGIEGVPTTLGPIIEYWMMITAAVSILVGYLYLVAALNPPKYKNLLPILGWGLVLIGVAAGFHGFRLGLPAWPLYGDVGICAICGSGIVWQSRTI